jgi:transcriptional regulator with XRE-family HTH domain
MDIAERLPQLRETKKLSQGDIERRTGLLRCYISRVENGHTVPSIETLEKISRALEVPIYQLFYDGQELTEVPLFSDNGKEGRATQRKGHGLLMKLRRALSRTSAADRHLLLHLATKMASANRKTRP